LLPAQLHVYGPVPVTAEAVPTVHRLAVGFALTVAPLLEPQAPLTGADVMRVAEHAAVVPPLLPAQVHVNGPAPATADAVPALHSPAAGFTFTASPFIGPQMPLTGVGPVAKVAEHMAVAPPPLPAQLHVYGPVPATADAVPALHRFAVGFALTVVPFAAPQAPLTAPDIA
jgi:hypothetical protein